MSKKTLVLGASLNPQRYSNIATKRLLQAGHETIPMGIQEGVIEGISIIGAREQLTDLDTITLYLNPQRQEAYYDYIIALKPKRIIFNPGTENPALAKMAREHNIEVQFACTLVLLSTDQY